jgi:hypothetical protein
MAATAQLGEGLELDAIVSSAARERPPPHFLDAEPATQLKTTRLVLITHGKSNNFFRLFVHLRLKPIIFGRRPNRLDKFVARRAFKAEDSASDRPR